MMVNGTSTQANLREAFDTLDKVRNTSSSNGKIEILQTQTHNEVLKTLLFLTYNQFIQYYIKKIPAIKPQGSGLSEVTYKAFLELLVQLKGRQVTGNAAIEALSEFLKTCSPEEFGWYTKVIQRDIKCGIAEKTINKVFNNLIPVYEVLLADKFEKVDLGLDTPRALRMLPDEYIVEPKLDGMRLEIDVYVGEQEVFMSSRNGKAIYGYKKLLDEAREKLPAGYVYDGELMSLEFEQTLQKAVDGAKFEQPESDCFNSLMNFAFSHAENKEGIFNIFDAVPIDEWKTRKTTQPLRQRKQFLSTLKSVEFSHIKILEWSQVFHKASEEDRQKTVELMRYFISIGYEGSMVKDLDAVYEFKRSKTLLKMKLMDLIDLEVTDVYEGEPGTKYVGMLGGVICDYKGYPLGVGSGWKDHERALYWEHPELIVGKTISVSYQNESNNQQGGVSLRFPVKKCIRQDK